jgi:inward rectifier potassium channel
MVKKSTTKRKVSIQDTGFSSRAENEGTRLLNKDGSFNVEKKGQFFLERFSVFHWLIKMSWLNFFLVMFLGYILINLLFASVYFLAGIEGLSGDHSNSLGNQFLDAFYFSTQTLTTVGYGYYSPVSQFHSLLASFESFLGLMSFAMATGLLYGKFSKPKAGIVFSDKALISPYKENEIALMIRLANAKENQIINANAKMMVSWVDPKSKGMSRKYYLLKLEINSINMLATSWNVVHPINEDSPLFGLSLEQLEKREAEVILQLQGYDETYSQEVYTRTSYKYNEMVWGAKFEPILNHEEGHATLNMAKLSSYEKVTL